MSDRARRRLALSLWIAAILFTAAAIPLALATREVTSLGFGAAAAAIALLWATVGARIAALKRGNAVGWLFCNVGLGIAVTQFCVLYTVYGLRIHTGIPGADVAAVVGEVGLAPSVGPIGLVFLLFPDGRPPDRRWRWLVWIVLGGLALAMAASMVQPETLKNYRDFGIRYPNPFGIASLGRVVPGVIAAGTIAAVAGSCGCVLALPYRYRRSRGSEREQIRWLALVAGTAFALAVATFAVGAFGEAWYGDVLLAALALTIGVGMPVATGIAILRYRLFDIDRIISRALGYGLLTAVLVGVYIAVVIGMGSALGRSDSPILIAGATLVIAALFGPARRRIQSVIDRRFYRRRYDAQRTLESFGARLRDEVDLSELRSRLVGVVSETMQPATVSLWLRWDSGR